MTTGFNPFKLRVNGQVYENGNGESAKDRLFRALAEKHEAKAAMILARDDEDDGPAPAPMDDISKAGKFLKDVGVDVDKMQERQDKEREKLEARAERAEKARLDERTADRSDGLNSLSTDLAKAGINALVSPKTDPVMDAVREVYAKKMVADLTGERPSAIQEMTDMMSGYGTMLKLMQTLAPAPPAAVAVGLSPEKAFELEIAKLKNDLEIQKYRADKDAEVAEKKASAWKEVFELLQTGLDGIGRTLGEVVVSQMGTGNGARPAAARQRPGAEARQTVEKTADKTSCPDCGEDAIMLTQGMIDRIKAGGEVRATCTNCGEGHTISDARAPAEERAAPPRQEEREPDLMPMYSGG